MDIRVGGLVEVAQLVEHLARLVRADRGVEVGERLAAHLVLEDREVGAKLARIEFRPNFYGHQTIVPRGYGRKRTSARPALARVSVTRHDKGMRYDSPFTIQARLCLVGFRIKTAERA